MKSFKDRIKFVPKEKYRPTSKGAKDFVDYKMYEEDGSFVGTVNPKHELMQNKWLRVVSCFVINSKGEILLEKRAKKVLDPEKIDLVSGHINKEENAEQAMARELQEEVGIRVTKRNQLQLLGALPIVLENSKGKRKFKAEIFCCKYNDEEIKLQEEEVDSICWLPMEEVFDLIRSGNTRVPYDTQMEEIFQKIRNTKGIDTERD